MAIDNLTEILSSHRKWLDNDGGAWANLQGANLQRAYLRGADLQGANLRGANLQWANLQRANLQGANLQGANLQRANLRGADLQGADLQGAYLQGADLQGANLQGANLDFSCFPLCCGGSHFKCDAKLVRQLFAHICTLDIVDADEGMKAAIKAILPEAKKSHRAEELEVE